LRIDESGAKVYAADAYRTTIFIPDTPTRMDFVSIQSLSSPLTVFFD